MIQQRSDAGIDFETLARRARQLIVSREIVEADFGEMTAPRLVIGDGVGHGQSSAAFAPSYVADFSLRKEICASIHFRF